MTKKAIEDAFEPPARRRGDEAARGRGALALRGRLGRGHERHPRGDDPAARGVRRRRVARPRADAHARARRPPRGGDPRVQARAVLARRGRVRGRRRAPLLRPLPGRQADRRGARRRRSSRTSATSAARSRSSRRRRSASSSQLLYDLTSLQRHANTLLRLLRRAARSARRRSSTSEHKAITYPRTNSRCLSGDLIPEIKPTAELVGQQPPVRARAPST